MTCFRTKVVRYYKAACAIFVNKNSLVHQLRSVLISSVQNIFIRKKTILILNKREYSLINQRSVPREHVKEIAKSSQMKFLTPSYNILGNFQLPTFHSKLWRSRNRAYFCCVVCSIFSEVPYVKCIRRSKLCPNILSQVLVEGWGIEV